MTSGDDGGPAIDVVEDGAASVDPCTIAMVNTLRLEHGEEALNDGVIVAVALRIMLTWMCSPASNFWSGGLVRRC